MGEMDVREMCRVGQVSGNDGIAEVESWTLSVRAATTGV